MKKYLKYLFIFILAAGVVGYFIYNKPHQNMQRAKAAYQLSATELFSMFESNENQANEKYLDQIIEIRGSVQSVSTDEDGQLSITLDCGNDMFGVICQLDDLTKQEKTSFEVGETVNFKGICTGMLMDVVLVRCVLVD